MTKITLVTLGITSLLACNLSGKIDDAIEQLDIFCTPGEEIECSCEDGEDGSQTCQEQGTSFSDCLCENSSALTACTPGEMDACVCEGTEDLGARTCLGNKEWDDCFCEEPETTTGGGTTESDHIPQTEWVLRDKNGEAVSAVFEPYCPDSVDQSCAKTQDIGTYPCVHITYLNGEFLNMAYDLASGDPRKCYYDYPDAKTTWYECAYDNGDCTGTPWCPSSNFLFNGPGGNVQVDKKMYWLNLSKPVQDHNQLFRYSIGDHACTPADETWYLKELRQPETVMDAKTFYVIDKAPYSISLE